MTFRSISIVSIASLLLVVPWENQGSCPPALADPVQIFRQLLQKIATSAPDPCSPPSGADDEAEAIESSIFEQAATVVTQELNATPNGPKSPQDQVTEALRRLDRVSAEINVGWPDENRFHFQIFDVPPALVLKMTIRTHARFFVFGFPTSVSEKPNRLWQQVGADEETFEHESPRSWLDIYPLHRGPSGNARFLAMFGYTGCAGSSGLVYDGEEWDRRGTGGIEQILKQEGAFGMDEVADGHTPTTKNPFIPIGKPHTQGPLITLPYCWFSAIDTWDNPSMCAVDRYDLSSDDIEFRSRSYNRPDLLPIAKAIEYAEKRDYPAVLGYCDSGELARNMVRELPPSFFAGDLQVTRKGDVKEHVEMDGYRFDVRKRSGRWLVVDFGAK